MEDEQNITRQEVEEYIQKVNDGRVSPGLERKGFYEGKFGEIINVQGTGKELIDINTQQVGIELMWYRPICLAQTSFKMYTIILKGRLRELIKSKLWGEQTTFRPGRHTIDNVFVLTIINIVEKLIKE